MEELHPRLLHEDLGPSSQSAWGFPVGQASVIKAQIKLDFCLCWVEGKPRSSSGHRKAQPGSPRVGHVEMLGV